MRKYLPWILFAGLAYAFWPKRASAASLSSSSNLSGGAITEQMDQKIWEILGQYESARNYSAINEGELSYGWLQSNIGATLGLLVNDYIINGGTYAYLLEPYRARLLAKDKSLIGDQGLHSALRTAGTDPVMHRTQWNFFHTQYLNPAYELGQTLGWTLPISYLALADQAIHSGIGNTQSYLQYRGNGSEIEQLRAFLNTALAEIRRKGKEDTRILQYLQAINENPTLAAPFRVRNTPIAGYHGYTSGYGFYGAYSNQPCIGPYPPIAASPYFRAMQR